jgi:hypothetical protein
LSPSVDKPRSFNASLRSATFIFFTSVSSVILYCLSYRVYRDGVRRSSKKESAECSCGHEDWVRCTFNPRDWADASGSNGTGLRIDSVT